MTHQSRSSELVPGRFVPSRFEEIAEGNLVTSNILLWESAFTCFSGHKSMSFCALPYFILRHPVDIVNAASRIQGQTNMEWLGQLTLHCLEPQRDCRWLSLKAALVTRWNFCVCLLAELSGKLQLNPRTRIGVPPDKEGAK